MKAEEIISMDSKTARKVLNYQGPVFLNVEKNVMVNMGLYLLEGRERYCKKCKKITSQEWVRNHTFKYWRCSECLEKQLKEEGIFMPPVTNFRLIGIHNKISKWNTKNK